MVIIKLELLENVFCQKKKNISPTESKFTVRFSFRFSETYDKKW